MGNLSSGHSSKGRRCWNLPEKTTAITGSAGSLTSLRSDCPLLFHTTHGENVHLNTDKSRATRADSFCKGICFSNRPISINEKVHIKFVETSASWSGVLRFGFTSIDPAQLRSSELPRYACPDLTNKQGNWAKALGERHAEGNNRLFFYVTRTGDVMYGINGEEKGLFFGGVHTSGPLWALLDIYGNTMTVEFTRPETGPAVMPASPLSPSTSGSDLLTTFQCLDISQTSGYDSAPQTAIHYHANVDFTPVYLHSTCGRNIRMSSDKTIAVRLREEYCNGYIFTSMPVSSEIIVMQIMGIDRSFVGGLAFGFTTCDPSLLTHHSLPDDSDFLLDRPEYWVVNKDVCRNPDVGDELSFYLTSEGEVHYSKNNGKMTTLMHVDVSMPLWMFFDVYGNVQKIKILGSAQPSQVRFQRSRSTSYGGLTVALPPRLSATTPVSPSQPGNVHTIMLRSLSVPASSSSLTVSSSGIPSSHYYPLQRPMSDLGSSLSVASSSENANADNENNECTVCYERPINCVLYTCGHMCMCFECATAVKQERGALCPICRQQIKDVIKIYRT